MKLLSCLLFLFASSAVAQMPPIEPGVSHDLAKWRSVQYSDIRYKLDLTLEKMSPVLKGTIEIRLQQAASACAEPNCPPLYIILDWRKLPGHEKDSRVSNVTLNGSPVALDSQQENHPVAAAATPLLRKEGSFTYAESNDHLIFHDGVVMGENVIKLDFTSPILTSGSAITRYIDKEDGSEYIYSLFVPSDASTAFPVFDQPDLKARFSLQLDFPDEWKAVSNAKVATDLTIQRGHGCGKDCSRSGALFQETKPISTYVFAFAAGNFDVKKECLSDGGWLKKNGINKCVDLRDDNRDWINIYVRHSQAAKFDPHTAEVFRLTRQGIKYLETYFDYKFPWPKYDLVLIPEFPFGGMEHAGATFLRESAVIFPTEPTNGDQISRSLLIFHETAHQWFGDTVTMRWFDDLWLKEGFAEFMAYKTLEHVMPDANAWKVFYERNKQAAYLTDSTKGTTPIYQKIDNLSAAKSAYGNIVYRKAPSFLRQAEFYLNDKPFFVGDSVFYLDEDKFQTAVRAFLKKHEYANAGWEDLVKEFEGASGKELKEWANVWVTRRGLPIVRTKWEGTGGKKIFSLVLSQKDALNLGGAWPLKTRVLIDEMGRRRIETASLSETRDPFFGINTKAEEAREYFAFPNYQDYGYGIFLLDDKSRDYVLKHIGEEKDPFLRSMMWGALWDSVREAELDPREYVELVIKQLSSNSSAMSPGFSRPGVDPKSPLANPKPPKGGTQNAPGETDETIVASLLGRVSVALNYYLPASDIALAHARASATSRPALSTAASAPSDLRAQLEAILLDRMQHADTPGQRITFYRAFVSNASTEKSREVLKQMLAQASGSRENHPVAAAATPLLRKEGSPDNAAAGLQLRTKDKFDIVTRLAVLGDPDAPKLLATLEKTETGDDAKRYAYAAHAAFATAENRAKYWNDFVNNKEISESWIEAAIPAFNSIRYPELSQPYLERALAELPNLKRTRKIFFINNWLAAWIGGQRDEKALAIVNKFLADNPNLDNDLRLKVLENVDLIERAVRIRKKFDH
jgi:aminopeptidase N